MSNSARCSTEKVGMRPPAQSAVAPAYTADARLLSPTDVAAMCGLSRRAVYDAIKRGELRAFKLCSRLRISTGDVDAWLASSWAPVTGVPAVPPLTRPSIESAPAGSFRARLRQDQGGRG